VAIIETSYLKTLVKSRPVTKSVQWILSNITANKHVYHWIPTNVRFFRLGIYIVHLRKTFHWTTSCSDWVDIVTGYCFDPVQSIFMWWLEFYLKLFTVRGIITWCVHRRHDILAEVSVSESWTGASDFSDKRVLK